MFTFATTMLISKKELRESVETAPRLGVGGVIAKFVIVQDGQILFLRRISVGTDEKGCGLVVNHSGYF